MKRLEDWCNAHRHVTMAMWGAFFLVMGVMLSPYLEFLTMASMDVEHWPFTPFSIVTILVMAATGVFMGWRLSVVPTNDQNASQGKRDRSPW